MNHVSQERWKELEVKQNTCSFPVTATPRAKEYWFWSTEHTFKVQRQLNSKKTLRKVLKTKFQECGSNVQKNSNLPILYKQEKKLYIQKS